ncbi:MAG: SGNH/GDSL hydrolase family protein [Clostridiales bacterium]|nr:SGNH/GDSL hydrolase family protein [Clostridiales bacterium]
MKLTKKTSNKNVFLILLLTLAVLLNAAGCKSNKDDGLYQFVVTSATTSEETTSSETMPSISFETTETESFQTESTTTESTTEETETEETESKTTSKATQKAKKVTKPTPKPTKKTIKASKQVTKKTVVTKPKYTEYLFVGDSRTVGLDACVSGISSKAKVGAKVDYLKSILSDVTKTRKKNVIFNFGVNDLGNINKYITVYKSLPKDFIKNNNVVIMSVNPTDGSKYGSWNTDIDKFNAKMKKNLPSGVKYLDTNSTLKKEGFSTRDGVHYKDVTYKRIAKLAFAFCGDKNRKV